MNFAPITLPEPAYRKTSVIQMLRRRTNRFARLLAEVAPGTYARTQGNAWDYYLALINWCAQRFPVWIPDYLAEEAWSEEELMMYVESLGIPVEPVGLNEDEAYAGSSATLEILTYLQVQRTMRTPLSVMMGGQWTKHAWLLPWATAEIDAKFMDPPRGREWAGVWKNLPWLMRYVYHDTGYQWLDLSLEDLDESVNPPWTKDDIVYLAKDWADAERIWKPLQKFVKWLDEAPEERLTTALAALTGDPVVRTAISQPKRVKTLAEVFDAQDKKAQRHTGRRAR